MKRVSIQLEDGVWRLVRARAFALEETVPSWVRRAVEMALATVNGSDAEMPVGLSSRRAVVGGTTPPVSTASRGGQPPMIDPMPTADAFTTVPDTGFRTRPILADRVSRGTSDPSSDPWSALCGRCGHPKRAHLVASSARMDLGRCGFGVNCGCRSYQEAG